MRKLTTVNWLGLGLELALGLGLVLLVGGCAEDEELPEDFLDQLTRTSTCGDTTIRLTNPARTIDLQFRAAGIVARAHEEGETQVLETDELGPQLVLRYGEALHDFCTDVANEPVIHGVWTATSGTSRLEVEPIDDDVSADPLGEAHLELYDVVMKGDGVRTVEIPEIVRSGLEVGAFAN